MKPGTALLFLSAVILFFSLSFTNYFVCDDYEFLGRVDLHNAVRYFWQSWGYGNEYRPLLVYTYAIDGAIGGRNPIEYHVVNTLLHGINGILVALIFRQLGLPVRAVLLTACIFILNPVAHESVLWIAGRPVILSTAFVLFSLWASLRSWWIAAYLSFIAGLLTYEGAVILPLLMVLAHWGRIRWRPVLGLFVVVMVYLVAWNLFFHFQITRFPVESSPVKGLRGIWTALCQSFHGSSRLVPALLYGGLLVTLSRLKAGGRFYLLAGLWFVCAYLPFIVVQGFADRFVYLSSAATAAALGFGVFTIYSRWKVAGSIAGLALLTFFAVGMVSRMLVWKRAGEIARRIPAEIKQSHPQLPPGATLVLLNVPDTYRGAYVFLTGLERAVALEYPGTPLLVLRKSRPGALGPLFTMDCSGEICRPK